MRRPLTLILIFTCCLAGTQRLYAQGADSDCLTVLSTAEDEFNAGRFFGIPDLLKDCLDRNRYSDEEKVRVYMLLTQVYLLTDNPKSAEESYLKLLTADPEYIATPEKDPIDVVYLSKKFTTTAIFTPHFKVGVNGTKEAVIYRQDTFSSPDSVKRVDKMLPGITLGGGIEWNVTDNLGVGAEVMLASKAFRTTNSGIFSDDVQKITERQTWIDIPFYVRYGDHIGKFRPYGYAGYALNLRLTAKASQQEYRDVITSEGKETTVSGADQDIRFKRTFFSQSVVVGGGLKYKIGKNFILLDVRYMAGLSNLAIEKNNYYNNKDRNSLYDGITQYAAIGDLFRINNLSFTVGYVKPLYNPRTIKKARTKSVSRKISKE